MSNGIATIEVKVTRKRVHVLGLGRTNRGQKFIRDNKELEVSSIASKNFKEEMAAAVKEILPE